VHEDIGSWRALEQIERHDAKPIDHEPDHRIRGQLVDFDALLLKEALQRTQQEIGIHDSARFLAIGTKTASVPEYRARSKMGRALQVLSSKFAFLNTPTINAGGTVPRVRAESRIRGSVAACARELASAKVPAYY